jgi:hypothetical protein
MDTKNQSVGFALFDVTTEQFAILEENVSKDADIRLGTNIRFGVDAPRKIIAVFTAFTFESKGNSFMKIEAGCHFRIKSESWDEMYNTSENSLIVPLGFIRHLAVITIGTTRGILHSKTENTCYSKFILPTINVVDLIKDEVTFNFNNNNEK